MTQTTDERAVKPPADARKPCKFVLVSTQRSGSTWVTDMLNSHPDVTCYSALFLPKGRGAHPVGAQMPYFFDLAEEQGIGRLRRPFASWRFTTDVFRTPRGGRAVGFKFMYSHFRILPWLLAYIALKRVRVIHLVRANKLDHVLSKEAATARGKYHRWEGEDVENPPVRLNVETLVGQLRWEEKKLAWARRMLRLLAVPVLEVAYEDLVEDPTRYDRILEFVGVGRGSAQLRTSLEKWNRATYEEAIANYDDVRRALHGTPFAPLLEPSG